MLDSYSIKKVVPRLLVGIILINLSFYLVVAAADLTRIVANGAGNLITTPFVKSDTLNFTLGDNASATQITAVLVGGFFLGREVRNNVDGFSNIFQGIFKSQKGTKSGAVFQSLHTFLFLIAIPIGLIVLAIMITLIFRQGLLILLAIVAPVACALYILPSTEKYFKKWWELFIKTLLVYPIIILTFAVSDVLASIIFQNNQGSLPGLIAGLIAMFAPLALIPFSFKFAGGAISAIYGVITTGRSKLGEMGPLKRNREQAKERWTASKVQGQAQAYRRATKIAADENAGGFRKLLARRRMSRIGPGIYQREGELNKLESERAQFEIDFGDDTLRRASTAVKTKVDVKDDQGNVIGSRDAWMSLGGKEFTEAEVMAGRRAAGNNQYALQRNIAHEINKAMTDGEWKHFENNVGVLEKQLGISHETMNSALIGAGFMMKGKTLIPKHASMSDGGYIMSGKNFVQEQFSTAGTWQSVARTAEDHRMDAMIYAELAAKKEALRQQTGNQNATLSQDEEDIMAQIEAIADGHVSYVSQFGGNTAAAVTQAQQMAQASGEQIAPSAAPEIKDAIELLTTITGKKRSATQVDIDQAKLQAMVDRRARSGIRISAGKDASGNQRII
jgi:hypothetical protein